MKMNDKYSKEIAWGFIDPIQLAVCQPYDKIKFDKIEFNNSNIKNKSFPKIIFEPKNKTYIAIWEDGTKDIDIFKPNHGDEYDLEKGMLYYIIKNYVGLGKFLDWARPILHPEESEENIIKRNNKNKKLFYEWYSEMKYTECPVNLKYLLKEINIFNIDTEDFNINVDVRFGIESVYRKNLTDNSRDRNVYMIKKGFPEKGFLRFFIRKLWNKGNPSLQYYQFKKLTYHFYKGCFDSVEKKYLK